VLAELPVLARISAKVLLWHRPCAAQPLPACEAIGPTQGLQQNRLELNSNSAACLTKPSQAGCPPDAWCEVSAHGRTYARAAQFPSTIPARYDQLCVPACAQAGPHLDGLAADQHVLQLRAQLAVQRVGLLAPLRAKLDHALHQAG